MYAGDNAYRSAVVAQGAGVIPDVSALQALETPRSYRKSHPGDYKCSLAERAVDVCFWRLADIEQGGCDFRSGPKADMSEQRVECLPMTQSGRLRSD